MLACHGYPTGLPTFLRMTLTANNILEYINPDMNFIAEIERHVQGSNGEYLDCILHFCQVRNIEIEQVVPLIKNTPSFKIAVQKEAERLNFLKRKKVKKK